VSVVVPPLKATVPAPLTGPLRLKTPALNPSVYPDKTFHDPLPPQGAVVVHKLAGKFSAALPVAAPTVTVPLLKKGMLTWLNEVPPVFSNTPPARLLNFGPAPPLYVRNASSCRFQVAELLTTAPFSIRNDRPLPPDANVTFAGVFSTPPFRITAPTLGNAIPPEAVVVPARLNVPPDHVKRPGKLSALAVPDKTPPVRFNGPAIVTGLVSFKFSVPPGMLVVPVTP
jgi:hypothetical protein